MKRLMVLFLCIGWVVSGWAADKKPLDHSVYDMWEMAEGEQIATDGDWVLYSVEPQEGDATFVIRSLETDSEFEVPRGDNGKFTYDGRFAVCTIKPSFEETRQAKIDDKKADEMPKDSLAIVNLATLNLTKIPRVKSFKVPEEGGSWLAYMMEPAPEEPDTTTTESEEDEEDDEDQDEEKSDKDQLVIRNLATGDEWMYPGVSSYVFNKPGTGLLFSVKGDSTLPTGLYHFDINETRIDTLLNGEGEYKQLTWDEDGEQVAFVAHQDTSDIEPKVFSLYYWEPGEDTAELLVDTLTTGLKANWAVSEHGNLNFSESGERLYLGTAPIPEPEDTTIVDFEVATLDVWSWTDPYLQPHQLKEKEKEINRTFRAVVDLDDNRFVQLADSTLPSVRWGREGDADVALGFDHLPYRQLVSWEGATYRDVYVVDVESGDRTLVERKQRGRIQLSPDAQYILWYSEPDSNWFCYDIDRKSRVNLTRDLSVAFWQETRYIPDYPGAYGPMGWSKDDEDLFLYDRYDIWRFDPNGDTGPVNVTQGAGRENKLEFRYHRLDRDERFFTPGQEWLFRTFDHTDMSAGFYRKTFGDDQAPEKLIKSDHRYEGLKKADEADVYIFTRESSRQSPDVWVSDPDFEDMQQQSHINPQQDEYYWPTVELVHWTSADGRPLKGLLYKPENFDPDKKYPMMVYFYERTSFIKNWYQPPRPSPSTVRSSFYGSRDYVFFIPDIVYGEGYPGRDAMDCVVSGTLDMIDRGFVDKDRIAIQGQSWGGYQVAYLVTKTNLYAAAMAGAPVSNMTSAYGGIRWGSGKSRMFQYEHTQSRIGGTLWEKPLHYLENSPVFTAPDIETPLLIMHNDNDGAVPWYQGIELFVAMRRLQKPAWMLVYNDESHNLSKRRNRKDLSIRMQQFFDHYLKDAPKPVWMEHGVPATKKGKTWGYELIGE